MSPCFSVSLKFESVNNCDDENEKDLVNVFSIQEGEHGDFKILKLLIDAGLSILDVITDLIFGISLTHREDASFYGYLVLGSCWVPALVIIIHMIAYYRENYASNPGKFFITITILFIFYPLAPFISFGISMWYFNTHSTTRVIGRIEKIINLAVDMEGCVEAPLQLIITTFLIMTRFLSVPWDSSPEESIIDLGKSLKKLIGFMQVAIFGTF